MLRIILSAAIGAVVLTAGAQAQTWPNRPVRIVVPSPPAGGTDIVARVMADHFSKAFKQQFFVENRPGAGNMIGIESVARAANDGYTFLMTASTLSINSVLYKKVSYDPIKDFAPITLAAMAPNVLIVNPSVPAKTLAEFVALAKKQPGKLTYGTPGIGTSPHMCMELFKSLAGVDLQHIPYRGTVPALTDVMSGQINAMFATALSADKAQRFLYSLDGWNKKIWILRRQDLKLLGSFGCPGHFAGCFYVPHGIAVDSKGNLYVADIQFGIPGETTDVVLTAAHRRQGAFAGATGKGIVNQGTLQHRPDIGHQRMMQHALAKARGMDHTRFRIADMKARHHAYRHARRRQQRSVCARPAPLRAADRPSAVSPHDPCARRAGPRGLRAGSGAPE